MIIANVDSDLITSKSFTRSIGCEDLPVTFNRKNYRSIAYILIMAVGNC